MTKYRIEYTRKDCIGAGSCVAADPDDYEMNADGKADLLGSKEKQGIWIKLIDESQLEANKNAAETCPVQVIKIFNSETNEQIV